MCILFPCISCFLQCWPHMRYSKHYSSIESPSTLHYPSILYSLCLFSFNHCTFPSSSYLLVFYYKLQFWFSFLTSNAFVGCECHNWMWILNIGKLFSDEEVMHIQENADLDGNSFCFDCQHITCFWKIVWIWGHVTVLFVREPHTLISVDLFM